METMNVPAEGEGKETATEKLEEALARLRAMIEDKYPELKDAVCDVQKALENVEKEAVVNHMKATLGDHPGIRDERPLQF
jgi:hypothetical protein